MPSVVNASPLIFSPFKESVNKDESCSVKDEDDGESRIKIMRKNSKRTRATMTIIRMRRVTLHRQFSSYQMTKNVKLLFKVHDIL